MKCGELQGETKPSGAKVKGQSSRHAVLMAGRLKQPTWTHPEDPNPTPCCCATGGCTEGCAAVLLCSKQHTPVVEERHNKIRLSCHELSLAVTCTSCDEKYILKESYKNGGGMVGVDKNGCKVAEG